MKNCLFIFIGFISVFSAESSQTDFYISYNSSCYETYLQKVIHINRIFKDALQACHDEDNINRRPPEELEPEAEIERHKQTSRETCLNLTTCNLITDLLTFFNCHSKNAEQNVHTFFVMQLNASSVVIELSDQYDQEEKEMLRCQLTAKRKYLTDSSDAYKEHLNCLNTFETKFVWKYI